MNKFQTVASDYAVAGVLMYIYGQTNENILHTYTVDRLTNQLQNYVHPEYNSDRIKYLVRIIEKLGIGEFYEDPFADPVFRISDNNIRDFFSSRAHDRDIYRRAWNLDLDWLATAFAKQEFWEQLDAETVEMATQLIPLDVGLIDLDSNSEAFKSASDLLDELLAKLGESNDVGSMTALEVETAKSQVAEIQAQLLEGQVESPEFYFDTKSTLVWIAKQAAGAVVGALALSALAAIFNIPLIPF